MELPVETNLPTTTLVVNGTVFDSFKLYTAARIPQV
jgi:hypothetical protein